MKCSPIALLLCFYWVGSSEGARMLLLSPIASKSHLIFYQGIAETLANKGHDITIIAPYQLKQHPKITYIKIPDYNFNEILNGAFTSPHSAIFNFLFKGPEMCSKSLALPQVQDVKKQHFDLVFATLFFSDCYLSLVDHFKAPSIYILPAGIFGYFSEIMNNVDFISISGNKLLPFTFPYNFLERAANIFTDRLMYAVSTFYIETKMRSLCEWEGLCAPTMASFQQIRNNASLVIANSISTLEHPVRPAMPHVIHAGGIHIKPAKPLPKELEDWVSQSGDAGFVLFSLGSALPSTAMPEQYRQIVVKVLGSLRQRVLWKWDQDTMADLPANVKISKWLPQQDILGHPKLRLFITHGGLLSTQESMYNGIPIIGMPVFADQFSNMRQVEGDGWGRVLQWGQLDEYTFKNMIQDVIVNKDMRATSQRLSAFMRDQVISPEAQVGFWVDYVLRHQGAEHLKSPLRHMSVIELYNIDVWVTFGFLFAVILYVNYRIARCLFRKCFGASRKDTNRPKQD